MKQYILGIDIGTGSTKGVAMDLDGKVTGSVQHHYDIDTSRHGVSEQDPELIWIAFINCIKDMVARMVSPPMAISLSSAMHSLLLADVNGKAISMMMTWADVRSESIAAKIRESTEGERLYRLTGTPIHPMSPLCKLIWLKQNHPALFETAEKFISIKEYIWFKLFKAFQIDYSVASATGLFDITRLCWSSEACEFAGVMQTKLSEPVNTNYTRADLEPPIAAILGIPLHTPFIIGASDGCCANLGSHVTQAGTAALTIGTSGAVRITSGQPVYDYDAMTFNYLLDEQTFVSGGAVNNGGNAVDWLLQQFMNIVKPVGADYDELFKAIEQIPPGSDGLIFMPYLYGERAPIWDAKTSGAYLNIRPKHGRDHFLRAALEGICYALNDVLKSLEDASVPVGQLNVSGGFITSASWMQLLADITGKRLFVMQLEDASAIGAIYLGMKAFYPEQYHASLLAAHNDMVIVPNITRHQLYARYFAMYKKLYSNLKESMALLYQLN